MGGINNEPASLTPCRHSSDMWGGGVSCILASPIQYEIQSLFASRSQVQQ